MENKSLIAKAQCGFVNKKSCTTNLLETLDIVGKSLSEGLDVDLIYLDSIDFFKI